MFRQYVTLNLPDNMLYCIIVGDAIETNFTEKILHGKKFLPVRIAGDDNSYTAYYIGSFPISEGSQKVHKIITPTRAPHYNNIIILISDRILLYTDTRAYCFNITLYHSIPSARFRTRTHSHTSPPRAPAGIPIYTHHPHYNNI